MSADRSELREELIEALESVDFPAESRAQIEREIDPSAAYRRIESGEFGMTLRRIGTVVNDSDVGGFPVESAESLVDALLDALEEKGYLDP